MFEIALKETFNYYGTAKELVVEINACVSPKLSLPFSNQSLPSPSSISWRLPMRQCRLKKQYRSLQAALAVAEK
jgi:hypothetical protein